MNSKVLSFIISQKLISNGDIVFAAVSGGMDSMAMLHCLQSLKERLKIDLKAVHVNHGVRPVDTDLDEELVHEVCSNYKIPLTVERLTGFDISANENDLRQSRYAAFQKVIDSYPGAKIATAHHLNDQLETFLMRLAKGSSLKGLRAIPSKRDEFIRPLLFLKKQEIEKYVNENKISYRDDYTNQDINKLRNCIRHKLAPVLIDTFGDDFYNGFKKSVDELNQIYEVYREYNNHLFEKIIKAGKNYLSVDIKNYKSLPVIQRRHLVEYCILKFYPLNFSVSYKFHREFDAFALFAKTGASFRFKNDLYVVKNRAALHFTNTATRIPKSGAELFLDREVCFRKNIITVKRVKCEQIRFASDVNCEYICSDRLKFPLKIRSWNYGDYFYPLGMASKQKLSDFFVNQKVAVYEKYEIPIVENDGEIVWIAGFRIDDRYKISKKCKQCYELKLVKDKE